MSRRRKALTIAGFGYLQQAFGVAVNFYLVRFLLVHIGQSNYGLWLAASALLSYASMADLGTFNVLPWLFAEAEGRKSDDEIRQVLSHALLFCTGAGFLYLIVAALSWKLFPFALRLESSDRGILLGPLCALALLTAIGFPLRVFSTVITGIQDVFFSGFWGLVQILLNAGLIIGFVRAGRGLYGLALAAVIPYLIQAAASLIRIRLTRPELLQKWSGFEWAKMRSILSSGLGAWLGAFGWQLSFASDSVVVAWLGQRALVPVLSVTAKLAFAGMQFGWVLPDSTLVGLAELSGAARERVKAIVMTILRLHLILAGGVAIVVLAVNPALVSKWLGPTLFGGHLLSALIAIGVLFLSFSHGVLATASVTGNRLRIGVISLVGGLVYVVVAVTLGKLWGLVGVASATIFVEATILIPFGLSTLSAASGIRPAEIVSQAIFPWATRFVPIAAIAAAVGMIPTRINILWIATVGGLVGLIYLWSLKPIYREIEFGPRTIRYLTMFKLR